MKKISDLSFNIFFMQLTVRPYHKNLYPRGGLLVRGNSVTGWLQQVQDMGLSLEEMDVYPIAGASANTIWGCLLVPPPGEGKWPADIGMNVYCQCMQEILFLPENSQLYPQLSVEELDKILKGKLHLFHPETGWVELPAPIVWKDLLAPPAGVDRLVVSPESSVFIPSHANAFYKQSIPYEDVLANMEEEFFHGIKPDTRPLSVWEKIKLRFLRVFRSGKKQPPSLKELEERNNREIHKLLDLFKKDPKEALQYAVPINNDGVSRGVSIPSAYRFSKFWENLPLLGNWLGAIGNSVSGSGYSSSGSGGSVILGKRYIDQLNQEYRNAAYTLMKNREYRQAAFVYLKLLKDYASGADALEKGGFYAEAASVYLKYVNNKLRAAECFEKGKLPLEAIELYKEMQRDEKVGDLYLSIGKRKEARPYFEKVIGQYVNNHQYIKAAAIHRDRLDEPAEAQALLLQGWRCGSDAVNCLTWYFALVPDARGLEQEIQTLYHRDTDEKNREKYLQVLKHQFDRYETIQDTVRDIAYEIVAARIEEDPFIASELQAFNKKDKRLLKDILLYRHRTKVLLWMIMLMYALNGNAQTKGRLNEFYYHVLTLREATVGFLGGSITYNPGWRDKVCAYLQKRFPETKFRFIAAGIPSLGSLPHAFRVQRDLLDSGRLDLLFLETAVNDRVNGTDSLTQLQALEGIVRHVERADPATNIVMMAFADEAKTADYNRGVTPAEIANQGRIAAYYGLPSINLGKEVADRITRGTLDWKRDFKDVHPAEFGQELYFSAIRQLLDSTFPSASPTKPAARKTLPPALDPACLANGRYVDVHRATHDEHWTIDERWQPDDSAKTRPGFVHVAVLAASAPGAELQFPFKGTAVGIAVVSGPDAGIIEYNIDDTPFKELDLYTKWSKSLHLPWYLLLGSGLTNAPHKLQLRISSDKNPNSKGSACRIVHFLVNG